jgi:hypothetical protein
MPASLPAFLWLGRFGECLPNTSLQFVQLRLSHTDGRLDLLGGLLQRVVAPQRVPFDRRKVIEELPQAGQSPALHRRIHLPRRDLRNGQF